MSIKVKQKDITDCGAACIASVAAHYNLKLPIARIRQIAGTDKKGTNVLGMVKAAENLGFSAKGVKGKLDSLSKIPLPSIAHIIINNKLHHYVVITTIKGDRVEYMDPGDGEIHKCNFEKFNDIWTGVLILLIPTEDFKEGNKKVPIYKRFLFLLKPHKTILGQCLFGAVVATILGLSTSIYIQKLIDHVFVNGNNNLLNLLSVLMLIALGFQVYINATKDVFMLKVGQRIDAQLILGYYKHLLKLPQQFFDTMRVGEIISRVNDASKIRYFINDTLITLTVNILIVFFSFGMLFFYSWKLALILLIVIPLYTVTYFISNFFNKKRERKMMESAAELESQFIESINSVKTIKQFGIEEFANIKTETRFVLLLKSIYKSSLNTFFSIHTSNTLSKIFTIVILWVGSQFVIKGDLTPGTLLSFYALIGYFTQPITSLIGANKTIQNALIAADRLFEIIDLEVEQENNKVNIKPGSFSNIEFQNVSFSYGTRVTVFDDFNLNIEIGKNIAIIGESGSGKTTLAAILQKIYPINGGNIKLGNYSINQVSNSSLRSLIGIVPQQLNLFSGSVLENIALGEFNPDMEKVLKICSMLGITKFIEELPNGFGTYIGENGASLSGGQKQRLAIARVLYKNPEIIVLDEATSSLDSESEHFVQEAINTLKAERKTIIVIAHRLSTVINSDEIIILSKGKIIEQGNHFELFSKKSIYYNMWQKQLPSFLKNQPFIS